MMVVLVNSLTPLGFRCHARLTRYEIKIKVKEIPRGMVDNAGTYHGTLGKAKYDYSVTYCENYPIYSPPVHPSQKIPMTRHGPAIIAPGSLSSGGGIPCHLRTISG